MPTSITELKYRTKPHQNSGYITKTSDNKSIIYAPNRITLNKLLQH